MKQSKQNIGPSQRQLRAGELLRHIIADVLQRRDLHHPDLLDMPAVTVTEVRASPDLKHATAYIIPLGGENIDALVEALNDCHAMFQKEINQKSELKFTPKIKFREDTSFAEGSRMDALLDNLHYSDQKDE